MKKKDIKLIQSNISKRMTRLVVDIIDKNICSDDKKIHERIWKAIYRTKGCFYESSYVRAYTGKSYYDIEHDEKTRTIEKINNLNYINQMLITMVVLVSSVGEIVGYDGTYKSETGDAIRLTGEVLADYGWYYEDGEEEVVNGTSELYVKNREGL
ncbi:MAG: hypothetical protein E7265_06710 [Lachnospiraceae bacterium]|nr:hypothetical protein [Lachnospiraceae bacterium]